MKIIRSSARTKKVWEEIAYRDCGEFDRDAPTVVVDTSQKFQTHCGFGGALTESTGAALSKATEKDRRRVLENYYSKEGLNYNLGRISVHSNDFSLGNYTYVSAEDRELSTFSLERDERFVLPLVREALSIRKLELLSSAWSPPAWMKTNGDMNYGGRLRKDCYGVWADYYVRFLLELRKQGIEVSMLTAQNEPEAVQLWDSCNFTAEEEADFLENHLIPRLDENGFGNVKILIWDHNRDRVVRRASVTLAGEKLRKRVWGVGYHWYVSCEHGNLSALHALFPEKHILLTESSVELTNAAEQGSEQASGKWEHAERYARQMIHDFNNFSEGWIDWNMVLDEEGGPNHVSNFCDAHVTVDSKTGEVTYNPSFYYVGHFSRYILPGARRVLCLNDEEKDLHTCAYENPDGSRVAVILNTDWVKKIAFIADGKGCNITLPPRSIVTVLF